MINLLQYHEINKAQREVDFLIPYLDIDRRYFLDPSLLRFSSTPFLLELHQELMDFLALVHSVIKQNDNNKLNHLLKIGEARDAGFGYCIEGVNGSGLGIEIAKNVSQILAQNEKFIETGFLRLEELQWLDVSVGPDRISDLAINILKRNLISYTQDQCKLLGIPMEKVRIDTVFYPDLLEWGTLTTELPINPYRQSNNPVNEHPGQILIPKEALKVLPMFLSYDGFHKFINPTENKKKTSLSNAKVFVVEKAIREPSLSEKYILHREAENNLLLRPDFDNEMTGVLESLDDIEPGAKNAKKYREIVTKIMTFLFDELFLLGQEIPTLSGDIQRDIVFRNDSTNGILYDLKNKYLATHIIVDAKNTERITPDDISRVADYLNDQVGRVGIIVAHKTDQKSLKNHQLTQLKDQKKVIIFYSNEDLKRLTNSKSKIKHISRQVVQSNAALTSLKNKFSDLMMS